MDGINNLFVPRVTLRPPHYSILADGFAVYRDNDTFYLGRAETGLVHRNEKHASVDSVIQRSWGQYHYEQPKRVPVMVYMTRLTPSKWTEEKWQPINHANHQPRGTKYRGARYSKTCPICNPDGWWREVRARNRRSKRKAGKGTIMHSR